MIGEIEAGTRAEKRLIAERDAVPFLMERGLRRKEARQLIQDHNGVAWRIEILTEKQGQPKILLPVGYTHGEVSKETAERKEDPENLIPMLVSEPSFSATPMNTGRRKTEVPESFPDAGFSESGLFPPEVSETPPPCHEEEKEEYWEGKVE